MTMIKKKKGKKRKGDFGSGQIFQQNLTDEPGHRESPSFFNRD